MTMNNIELDAKVKCIEKRATQTQFAENVGMMRQYANHIIKKRNDVVSKVFVRIFDALGYDIELTYVKRGAK